MSSLYKALRKLIDVTFHSAHVWVKEIGNHAKIQRHKTIVSLIQK